MSEAPGPRARYSHIGICVAHLHRSEAFYANVLGFEERGRLGIDNEHAALLSLTGDVSLRSTFMRRGDLLIELLHFRTPASSGIGDIRAMTQAGITHLSFNVDSLDETASAVMAWGGTVLLETRSVFTLPQMTGEIIFVTDPDGTRIELMAFPEDVRNG